MLYWKEDVRVIQFTPKQNCHHNLYIIISTQTLSLFFIFKNLTSHPYITNNYQISLLFNYILMKTNIHKLRVQQNWLWKVHIFSKVMCSIIAQNKEWDWFDQLHTCHFSKWCWINSTFKSFFSIILTKLKISYSRVKEWLFQRKISLNI